MRLKTTLLITCLLSIFTISVHAQDTIPDLIISEAQFNTQGMNYIELTNMGDTAIDLSQFKIEMYNQFPQLWILNNFNQQVRLKGSLEPGKSYVISAVLEGLAGSGRKLYRPKMTAKSDLVIYPLENLPADSPVKDSISDEGYALLTVWGSRGIFAIRYFTPAGDSIIIDAVNHSIRTDDFRWGGLLSVAGIPEAALTHVLVRKADVQQGTPLNDYESDWDAARGTDIGDSRWIPIQHNGNDPEGIIFRTVGNHGDFPINVQADNPDISIDPDAPSMTIPWGILKGDSIINELTLGDGMAWLYTEKPSLEDSVHTICQTGDILTLYACGIGLEQKDFVLNVSPPKASMANVYPLRHKNFPDPDDPIGNWVTPLYVTEDAPVIDTIGNVAYAMRVDSLYEFLEKAPNANWTIDWVDDTERVDLKYGDKLIVTAEDGSTIKEYFIDVQEIQLNSNADLAAITWPEIDLEEIDRITYGWLNGDTIPGFSPTVSSYTIKLPSGTTNVPALNALVQNQNAKIIQTRATSLEGGLNERTTTFQVTAEDDTTVLTYKVIFNVEKPLGSTQPLYADPIISEVIVRWYNRTCFVELYNPGNKPLDLSNYMLVLAKGVSLPEMIQPSFKFDDRYMYYVPGSKYTSDTGKYANTGRMLEYDLVDPTIDPGETFIIAAWLDDAKIGQNEWTIPMADVYFDEVTPNHWDQVFPRGKAVGYHHGMVDSELLYRIDNDSILTGEKAIGDPGDFTLIDAFGSYDLTPWSVGGISCVISGKKKTNGWRYIRKPQFWHGNPDNLASMGTSEEDSEWIVQSNVIETITQPEIIDNLAAHVMDPVTEHISTVSSLEYKVAVGFEGDNLYINGVSNGETIQAFFDKLIKADTGQQLLVTGADGVAKGLGDPVVLNDTLAVTSASGDNITKYGISVDPLDANTNLVAADGSGLAVDNTAGTITGFAFGATVQSVFEHISTESELSVLSVIDTANNLVPLKVLRADDSYGHTVIGSTISFEVRAQSGVVKVFSLNPASSASDAYVISDVYVVDNESAWISNIHDGTSVETFFGMIEVVTGATATLVDKIGFERMDGDLKFDDQLIVVSEDKSSQIIYNLVFMTEMEINEAPIVSVAYMDSTILKGSTIMLSATASDDDIPLPPSLSYKWEVTAGNADYVDIASAAELSTNATFSAAGIYELTMTVFDGALSTSETINVTVENPTGIDGRSLLNMKLYPNPAREMVNVELEHMDPSATTLSIIDLSGRVVLNQKTSVRSSQIDISGIESGMYYVSVRSGAAKLNQKLYIVK